MTRTVLVCLVLAVFIVGGCTPADSGRGQMKPTEKVSFGGIKRIEQVTGQENELVEDLTQNRAEYKQSLESLLEYYTNSGNNMKMRWAQKELKDLERLTRYNYLLQASVAGAGLQATDSIKEADDLYYEAMAIENKARQLILIQDNDKLRLALEMYNDLIKEYPTSDKVDDAAFRAGKIYEQFEDYSIAVLYYKRAYQWAIKDVYPARYRAAYILDRRLSRRDEALELYKLSIEREGLPANYQEFAQMRIDEITAAELGQPN